MIFDFKIKSKKDLDELIKAVLKYKPVQVNISNTSKKDDLQGVVRYFTRFNLSATSLCVHYSISNNYCGSYNLAVRKFFDFVKFVQLLAPSTKILLVSGGQHKKLRTAALLNIYSQEYGLQKDFGVAYNPFEIDILSENRSLQQKLNSGLVSQIYFQLGNNLVKLQQGIEFVKNELNQRQLQDKVKLFGCVLYLNRVNLQKMRFRLLRGVLYTKEFLNNLDNAKTINNEIISLYKNSNITPLWEFAPLREVIKIWDNISQAKISDYLIS